MECIGSKKQLAIGLSRLTKIEGVDRGLEQYQTDSELAAEVLWNAHMLKDVENNFVYDLGCGNGIFGIGGLILGAEQAVFIDIDVKAIEITKQNIDALKDEFQEKSTVINRDISVLEFESPENRAAKNVVVMNPPFGTKNEHADRAFLEKAFTFADVVYSIHKVESKGFLEEFSKDNGFNITNIWEHEFKIKKSHEKHKKDNYAVNVVCVRLERNKPTNASEA